jgi:hypothetical protein
MREKEGDEADESNHPTVDPCDAPGPVFGLCTRFGAKASTYAKFAQIHR